MGGAVVVGGRVVVVVDVVVEVEDVVVVEVLVVASGRVVVVDGRGATVDCGAFAAPSEELAVHPVRTNATATTP